MNSQSENKSFPGNQLPASDSTLPAHTEFKLNADQWLKFHHAFDREESSLKPKLQLLLNEPSALFSSQKTDANPETNLRGLLLAGANSPQDAPADVAYFDLLRKRVRKAA